ncbi:chymotrypsin-2-like [Periplaneta americana]|uniref:chymotrypsin-2-like n=1 Tax=Periplaneta americana TaxID=6978 RepID=UPI0037E79F05
MHVPLHSVMLKTMLLSVILCLIAVCELSDGSATNEVGSPLKPRIIGGRNATQNEFPFVVAVLNRGGLLCTGTIMSRRFILTAGHCVVNKTRDDITVKAGFYIWKDPNAVFRKVQYMRVHPQYRIHYRRAFDIALLKMTNPLDYNPATQPISLPLLHDTLPDETKVKFAGWGTIQLGINPIRPQILQALDGATISIEDCKVSWPKLANNTICFSSGTSTATPFKDACKGDSGGPLVVNNVQWGIHAQGSMFCKGELPIRFIGVSRFTTWIRNTISRDYYRRRRTTAAM